MPGSEEARRNLDAFKQRLLAGVYALAQARGLLMEGEAKIRAPWRDRTTHARGGLFGEAVMEPERIAVRLSHSMEYGVWLELCHHKRYAIIEPTIKRHAPVFMRDVERLVRGT